MKKIKKEYYYIFILLILFILLTFYVISGKSIDIDKPFFEQIIKYKNTTITNILYFITNLASFFGIILIAILISLIFIKEKRISDFKYVILNIITGVLTMQGLKSIIRRNRPPWKWIKQGGFSYPSGHTISAMLLYGTIILLVSKNYNGKAKKLIISLCVIMIFLTGISRIYFGVHYLTDVLGSLLLGIIILLITNIIIDKEYKLDDKNRTEK